MADVTRRQALAALGCFGAGFGLSGCAAPIVPLCPGDPTISDQTTPLTIDVHSHVFNGSDLQVAGFYQYVVARKVEKQIIAVILQMLAQDFAPTGIEELAALMEVEAALRGCDVQTYIQVFSSHAQDRYDRFLSALKAANEKVRAQRFAQASTSRRLDNFISNLPSDYREYRRNRARLRLTDPTLAGEFAFVLRNFQYRYVNVYDYLLDYSTGRARKIDIMVAHLVDFDWPLGGGNTTTTHLIDQFRVMDKISQITSGRVLCFAPFDPFKEVAYQLKLTTESSFQNVQTAILHHGFVGVKIYPPMGFAPFGNGTLRKDLWDQTWIPTSLHGRDLGPLLDQALMKLYAWCVDNGVPIMGHSSRTSGPSDEFQNLAGAQYWGPIPNGLAGIRIDYGHFGLVDLTTKDQECILASYMDEGNGSFLYADSGYFAEVLSQEPSLQGFMASLYRETHLKGDAALAQRMMYGTDWEMIVREGGTSANYLTKFEEMYAALDHYQHMGAKGKLSDRFFGVNAATYLGLGPNQLTRKRLDRYYSVSSKPAWMAKVDNLPAAIS